jgi:hypothetical protein
VALFELNEVYQPNQSMCGELYRQPASANFQMGEATDWPSQHWLQKEATICFSLEQQHLQKATFSTN